MRKILAALLFCALGAPPAQAGAWLREHKSVFVAVGSTVRGSLEVPLESENSVYAEYGAWPRLTFGIDYNEIRGKAGHALLFVRVPIGPTDRRTRFATDVSVGRHHQQGVWSPMYKLAFAVGRGFDSRWGSGWMAAETAYEVRTAQPDPAIKLDAVIGLSSGPRVRPLLKLETLYLPDKPVGWSVTPGIMFDVGKSTWVIGVERRSSLKKTYGLTFGLWRSF